MQADHYATLGLAPYADHAAVREAYLALMRVYHPDRNASAEAAARAREVTAAYEVLGNRDSRSDYDLARAQAHAMAYSASPRFGLRRGAAALIISAGVAGLMLLLVMPTAPERAERAERAPAATPPAAPPRKTAAAPMRAPAPAADKPAPAAAVEAPAVAEPPRPPAPVAAANPRPPVEAPRSPLPRRAAPTPPPPPRAEPAPTAQKASAGEPRSSSAAVGGLDRHLSLLFNQSMRRADPAKQRALYRDHYRFIARLNGCASDSCARREYLGRMGEISATMAAPAKPR